MYDPPIEIPGSSEYCHAEELANDCKCEFDLDQNFKCENCDASSGDCYFISDGGYEPRDGTYFCHKCCIGRFVGVN